MENYQNIIQEKRLLSLTTSAILREIFVFWIFVLLKELITCDRWSHMEVQQ